VAQTLSASVSTEPVQVCPPPALRTCAATQRVAHLEGGAALGGVHPHPWWEEWAADSIVRT